MTLVAPSFFKAGPVGAEHLYQAQRLRRVIQTMLVDQEGVLGDRDMVASPDTPAGRRVKIAPGRAIVTGDAVVRQGVYVEEVIAEMLSPIANAADATFARIDLLVLKENDIAPDGGSAPTDNAVFEWVHGVPAASPLVPALPGSCLPIVEATLPAGAAAYTTLRDVRPRAAFTAPGANLAPNSAFDQWSRGTTSAPDGWKTSGAGTLAQDTANLDGGHRYAVALTNTASNPFDLATLLGTGTGGDVVALRGRTITMTARVRAAAAGRAHLRILADSVVLATSTSHTGGSAFETLTVTATIPATATNVELRSGITTGTAITVQVAKVSCAIGNVAPSWGPRHPVIDELMSGRVYERKGVTNFTLYQGASLASSFPIQYQTKKSTVGATITLSSTTFSNGSAANVNSSDLDGFAVQWNATALGQTNISTAWDSVI